MENETPLEEEYGSWNVVLPGTAIAAVRPSLMVVEDSILPFYKKC